LSLTTKGVGVEIKPSLRSGQQQTTATRAARHAPPVLSIVIPCFNEELVIEQTALRLTEVLRDLMAAGKVSADSFIYLVDNGSRDATWEQIAKLHRRDDARVKGLKLVRNVGVQNALLAGLISVKDHVDCAVSIDADLQQDERAIAAFLEKYERGAQIVYGVRRDRATDSYLRKSASTLFYNLMSLMGTQVVKNHSEYRLLSRQVLDALSEYQEYNLFLRGILVDMGFKSELVLFDVRPRSNGRSKHTWRNLGSLALDAITSTSVVPLRFVTMAGMLIFVWSCLMSVFILYHKLWRGDTIPGWAAILIPIYFLGGVQIMFMGIVGEYIGKLYKEAKSRPRYIKDAELF